MEGLAFVRAAYPRKHPAALQLRAVAKETAAIVDLFVTPAPERSFFSYMRIEVDISSRLRFSVVTVRIWGVELQNHCRGGEAT
jgi:hypothetical protein